MERRKFREISIYHPIRLVIITTIIATGAIAPSVACHIQIEADPQLIFTSRTHFFSRVGCINSKCFRGRLQHYVNIASLFCLQAVVELCILEKIQIQYMTTKQLSYMHEHIPIVFLYTFIHNNKNLHNKLTVIVLPYVVLSL